MSTPRYNNICKKEHVNRRNSKHISQILFDYKRKLIDEFFYLLLNTIVLNFVEKFLGLQIRL